jgi:muramidase (phage lysozyme)
VQAGGDVNAFGGGVGNATEALGQQIEARAIERQKEEDAKAVQDLRTQFDADDVDFFHKPETGLFSQQGDAAKGSYEKAVNYYKEQTKKYEGLARNQNQKQLLINLSTNKISTYLKNSSIYEAEQFQLARDAATTETIESNKRGVVANWNNADGMKSFLDGGINGIILNTKGKPQAVVDQKLREFTDNSIGGAIDAALNFNDLTMARKTLNSYSSLIDPAKMAEYNQKIYVREEKILVDRAAREAVNSSSSIDEARVKAYAQAEGKVSFADWSSRVSKAESNDDYTVTSPVGAYGKYQIMPDTWKQWAPKVGLSADAPMTPENQEKVGPAILKSYYDKYGPYAGAVAFYAGEENGKRVLAGKTTLINDEGQEYGLYDKQGEFPSVHEYAQDKARGEVNPETKIRLDNQIDAEWSDKRTKKAWAREDAMISLKNSLAQSSGLLADKFALIDNAPGLEPYEKEMLKTQYKSRQESDIDTRAFLNKAARENTLTVRDVENVRNLLTGEHYLDYLEKAEKVAGGRSDKDTTIADKKWAADLKINGPFAGDTARTNKLEVEIEDELNRNGIKGDKRYPAALDIIERERKEKGSVMNYSANNNVVRRSLVEKYNKIYGEGFGEKYIQNQETGFKQTGQWNGDYGRMQNFNDIVDREVDSGDPYAREARNLLATANIGINDTTYRNAYEYIQKLYPELANKPMPIEPTVPDPAPVLPDVYDPESGMRVGSVGDVLKREGLTWVAPYVMGIQQQTEPAPQNGAASPAASQPLNTDATPGSFLDRLRKEGLGTLASDARK